MSKINKKTIKKILIVITSIISSFFCILCLIFIALIGIFKINFNKDNVDNYIIEYNVADSIKVDSDFINNILNDLLLDSGLDENTIKEFIDCEEFNNFKNEIVNSVLSDIFNDRDISFEFNSDKIENLLYENIPELSNKINIKISNKIKSKIPSIVDKLNLLLDEFKDKINNSDEVKLIKNYIIRFINIIDILLIISLVLLIILVINLFMCIVLMKDKHYRGFIYLFCSFICSSIILYVFKKIIKSGLNLPLKMNDWFNVFIILYLLIGIIIILVYIVIIYKSKKDGSSNEKNRRNDIERII